MAVIGVVSLAAGFGFLVLANPRLASAQPGFGVLSISQWGPDLNGDEHAVGDIVNNGTFVIGGIRIDLTLYDSSNAVIGSDFTFSSIDTMAPGDKSPFEDVFTAPPGYDHFQVTNIREFNPTTANHVFTTTVTSHFRDSNGDTHYVGSVTNNNYTADAYVDAVFTFYNGTTAVATDDTLVNTDSHGDLGPRQTAPFEEILGTSDPAFPAYTSYAVLTQSPTFADTLGNNPPPPFEVALRADNGTLWTVGNSGWRDWHLGMAAGTNPSVARLGAVPALFTGLYEIAFQADGGSLWSVGSAGWTNWGLGMAPGTSPSIVRLSNGGYEIAFQGAGGNLWTVGTGGWTSWPLGMAPGTSPSIVGLSNGGFEVAFQAAGGALWTVGTAGWRNWNVGLNPGTNPSMEGLPNGGFEIAFQAAGGALWTVGTASWTNWGVGLAPGTSPSIVRLNNGGFQIAFQAAGGGLWSIGTQGWNNWAVGVADGTSPSIAAVTPLSGYPNGGGYEIAFQAAGTGDLWTIGTAGWFDQPAAVADGSSPAAA